MKVLASQKQLENKYKASQTTADDWYRRAKLALEKGDEMLAPNITQPQSLNSGAEFDGAPMGSGEVRMPAPVGPFCWPSPFCPLDDFLFFILLNLGSTAQITLGGPL